LGCATAVMEFSTALLTHVKPDCSGCTGGAVLWLLATQGWARRQSATIVAGECSGRAAGEKRTSRQRSEWTSPRPLERPCKGFGKTACCVARFVLGNNVRVGCCSCKVCARRRGSGTNRQDGVSRQLDSAN
jgi:hypothetical protein